MIIPRWFDRVLSVGFLVAIQESWAQTDSSPVADAEGSISSNAFFQNISAIGQGSPGGFNQDAANQNYIGFLKTFVLDPRLDADTAGVADENDPDDDNDDLLDTTELAGDGFNPAIPFLLPALPEARRLRHRRRSVQRRKP